MFKSLAESEPEGPPIHPYRRRGTSEPSTKLTKTKRQFEAQQNGVLSRDESVTISHELERQGEYETEVLCERSGCFRIHLKILHKDRVFFESTEDSVGKKNRQFNETFTVPHDMAPATFEMTIKCTEVGLSFRSSKGIYKFHLVRKIYAGDALKPAEDMLLLKLVLDDTRRVIKVNKPVTLEQVQQRVEKEFGMIGLALYYHDVEAEAVEIRSQEGLEAFLDSHPENLKLTVKTTPETTTLSTPQNNNDHADAASPRGSYAHTYTGTPRPSRANSEPVSTTAPSQYHSMHRNNRGGGSGGSRSASVYNSSSNTNINNINNNSNNNNNNNDNWNGNNTERRRGGHIKWRKANLLGKGAVGHVYLGMDLATGKLLAVKQVDLAEGVSDEEIERLEAEINLMRRLYHEHIVRYLGVEKTEDNINIFLEYVPGGSIQSLLKKFGRFGESVVKLYTRQILEGLDYLHRNNILHRDIKGANILVDESGIVKLADFGSSRSIQDIKQSSLAGTPNFMAPEVIKKAQYTEGSDVWSVGCTVLEMLTGLPPWSHMNFDNPYAAMFYIGRSGKTPKIPDDIPVSDHARDFIETCFKLDAQERPVASELLRHPFITEPWPEDDGSSDEEDIVVDDSPSTPGGRGVMPTTPSSGEEAFLDVSDTEDNNNNNNNNNDNDKINNDKNDIDDHEHDNNEEEKDKNRDVDQASPTTTTIKPTKTKTKTKTTTTTSSKPSKVPKISIDQDKNTIKESTSRKAEQSPSPAPSPSSSTSSSPRRSGEQSDKSSSEDKPKNKSSHERRKTILEDLEQEEGGGLGLVGSEMQNARSMKVSSKRKIPSQKSIMNFLRKRAASHRTMIRHHSKKQT